MRRPIRLNRAAAPLLGRWLNRGCPDPRLLLDPDISNDDFTRIVSRLRIGGTYKTTTFGRYPKALEYLKGLRFKTAPIVLDVGASDGSASLLAIKELSYSRYYLTDRYIDLRFIQHGGGLYFLADTQKPFLYANRFLVAFNETDDAVWPFSFIVKALFAKFREDAGASTRSVRLVNPSLVPFMRGGVRIETYDIFEKWRNERVDIVIAANLLNRGYFPDCEIVKGVRNLMDAMNDDGLLVVVKNNGTENASVFRRKGDQFVTEWETERGCPIKDLILDLNAR